MSRGVARRAVGAGSEPAPTTTTTTAATIGWCGVPEIVRQFKTFSARRINALRSTPNVRVWQRNYYEHIIRDEDSLDRIRRYIIENPEGWVMDRENPNEEATGRSPLPQDEPWHV